MISKHIPSETILVLTSGGIKFPQTEKPKPTNQRLDSLVKCLKSEIKVVGIIQILCGLMRLSLGLILISSSSSSQFTPLFSNLLNAGYPFTGAICVPSSLITKILSCSFAVVGFSILYIGLVALGHASQQGDLDRGYAILMVLYPFWFEILGEGQGYVKERG
ncbi:membrane-spanning 4-domains subfamily A member 6A-like [Loxodonta africana]|uniref:membrane-spanning 4-domains subfamily A member 6A-like n=1 Tax=Loxodonta africana TaxID=9785 RepID=UPI0030D175F8